MNDTNSVVATEYRDRKTWLLVVGILQVVMGAGAWLLALLTGLLALKMVGQGVSAASIVPGVAFYVLGGAVFVVLGIGTIRARRWARSIWHVLSVGWLLSGTVGVVIMAIVIPKMIHGMIPQGAGQAPTAAFVIPMVIMGFIMAVFLILVPLGFLLFFRSPDVKATCEAANPAPSWTDGFPVSVLACILWMGCLAAMFSVMPLAYGGMYPAFGIFARGLPGAVLWGLTAIACGLSAYGLFRRGMWGWTLGVIVVAGFGIASMLTYAQADVREMYSAMGMMEFQIEQIERMGMMSSGYMVGSSLIFMLPFLALLCWARSSVREK